MFSTPVPDITDLKARITDAFATITQDMLGNTRREIDYRRGSQPVLRGALRVPRALPRCSAAAPGK